PGIRASIVEGETPVRSGCVPGTVPKVPVRSVGKALETVLLPEPGAFTITSPRPAAAGIVTVITVLPALALTPVTRPIGFALVAGVPEGANHTSLPVAPKCEP